MDKQKKKPKMQDFETEEGLNYLTSLYRDNYYTDEEAAKELGITSRTIINWRNKSKAIDEAISKGKSHVDTMVENALLKQALNGNVNAAIYWLQNRKPHMWKSEKSRANEKEAEEQRQIIIVDRWANDKE